MRKMEDIKLGTNEGTVKQQTCNFPESLDNLNRLSLASLFHSFYLASPGTGRSHRLSACVLGLGPALNHSGHCLLGRRLASHPVARRYLMSAGPAQAKASHAA
jgi:hypothetical protein